MEIGVILGDVRTSVSPRDHLDQLLRQVEAAQRNGLTYVTIGHHYLYGDLRWLQPVPTLARLAAELDEHVTLATTIIQAPLYHPVALAEELATLDIMSRRAVAGVGAGYRSDEFTALGVDFTQRFAMLDESVGPWADSDRGPRHAYRPVLAAGGRPPAHPSLAGAASAALGRGDGSGRGAPLRPAG